MKRKVFRSRHIYTAVSEQMIDGYVITENEKILFAGSIEEGKAYITEGSEEFDFSENFIMPGINDFHVHLVNAGVLEYDGVLRYTKSEEEAASFLWELHKDKKDKNWILGGAWDHFLWPGQKLPTKATLDGYFPDTPLFLLNKECHGAWVNSEALRRFNVTRDTPDPENGKFSRMENGEPDGYLHEMAALEMQEKIFSTISDEKIAKYSKSLIDIANRNGITSLGDVAGGAPLRDTAYSRLEKDGQLTARIHFYPFLKEGPELIGKKKRRYDSDRLKCCGAKAFIDGTPQGHTGYMLEGYSDEPENRSAPMIPEKEFVQAICDFDAAGIQTRVHACGDAGVRLCLDAVEEAQRRNGKNGVRHCIEHLESVSNHDIARFAELGVIASVQPEHLPKYDFYEHPFHKILGEDRMRYSWPFESIRKAGGILAFGTDCPVVDISPFRGIYRAVTRLTNDGEPEGGWNPREKVSVHESLRAYTYGGAYAAGREEELGTLEAGKLADMAILEKNLFECAFDKDEMFNMKVLMTVMNGDVVYSE